MRPDVVYDVRPGTLLQIAFHVQRHLPQVEHDPGMMELREAAQGVPDGQPQELELSNLQSFRYQHVPRCLFPEARHGGHGAIRHENAGRHWAQAADL